MESYEMIILGLLILNIVFIFAVVLMKVRINMLSREVRELKWNMEFTSNDMDLLAEAVRSLGGPK